jgi:hypothetical protein
MKKLLPIILIIILFTSCRETWTTGTKNRFYEGCTEEAAKWTGSEAMAKTYCDCVLEKMMAKYRHEIDALEHIDSLAKDPDLIACKEDILKKEQ